MIAAASDQHDDMATVQVYKDGVCGYPEYRHFMAWTAPMPDSPAPQEWGRILYAADLIWPTEAL